MSLEFNPLRLSTPLLEPRGSHTLLCGSRICLALSSNMFLGLLHPCGYHLASEMALKPRFSQLSAQLPANRPDILSQGPDHRMLPAVCVECSSVGHCSRGIHRPAHAPGLVKDGPVPEHLDHWQAYVHTCACAHTHTHTHTHSKTLSLSTRS